MKHDLIQMTAFVLVVAVGLGLLHYLFLPVFASFIKEMFACSGRDGAPQCLGIPMLLFVMPVVGFMFGMLWVGSWVGKRLASRMTNDPSK